MDKRQVAITATAVVLALVLGIGITLLATSGGDDGGSASDVPPRRSTTTSSTPGPTTTSTVPRPVVTVPTLPPPTIKVVPPATDAPTPSTTKPRTAKRPRRTTTTPPTTSAPQALPQSAPQQPPATEPPATQAPTTQPPVTQAPATSTTSTSTTTTTAPPPGQTGISPTQLRVAVVADDQATLDGAAAWANALNREGGLAGRKVRVDLLATDGTPEGYDAAVAAACDRAFAMVATRSSNDANVEPLSCGIPDVAVEAVAPEHADNVTTYAAFPRREAIASVGPYHWFQDELDDCCAQYVLVPAEGPDRVATERAIHAAEQIGYTTAAAPDVPLDAPESEYDAYAADLVASRASFAASGLGPDSTLELRRAAARTGGSEVQAWYCDARCYDATFAAEADADGQHTAIETVPFGDRKEVPELRAYLAAAARTGDPHTYAGLQAYVAGLLFEDGVEAVVAQHGEDGLTRERLLAALGEIDAFTGGGLVGPTDVGARTPNGCFVLLQVTDGRFARVEPAERGSLDCGADNLVVLDSSPPL